MRDDDDLNTIDQAGYLPPLFTIHMPILSKHRENVEKDAACRLK